MRTHTSAAELPPPPPGRKGWPWTGEGVPLPETMSGGRQWPRISVITPSYNQAPYLEAAIRSVLLQGYPNLEYMIMDGGSTDGSLEVIKKYEPWLTHWQSRPDRGQYFAINSGLDLSSGDVMAWLNSDDFYFPWALRSVGEIMATFPQIEWLSTENITLSDSEGGMFNFTHIDGFTRFWFLYYRQHRVTRSFIQQESTFWRSSLWQRSGGRLDTSLDYAADFELWARFYEHANLVSTNVPLGVFRYQERQKTNNLEKYLEDVNTVISKYPKPINPPYRLLRLLVPILGRTAPEVNWFGRRGERVWYDARIGKWHLQAYWYM